MKAFMDKEFMLQSPTAQHLYHAYAEDMPICDSFLHVTYFDKSVTIPQHCSSVFVSFIHF